MRFTTASLLAVATAVVTGQWNPTPGFAAMTEPEPNEVVPAGQVKKIVWIPNSQFAGHVLNITLIGGASAASLEDVSNIAINVKQEGGSFDWAVNPTLGDKAKYGIRIDSLTTKGVFQWSNSFTIAKQQTVTKPTSPGSSSPASPVSPLNPIAPVTPANSPSYGSDAESDYGSAYGSDDVDDDVANPVGPSAPVATAPPHSIPAVPKTPTIAHAPAVPGKNWTNTAHDAASTSRPHHASSTICTKGAHATMHATATASHAPTGTGSVPGRTSTPTFVPTAAAPVTAARPLAVLGCLAMVFLVM